MASRTLAYASSTRSCAHRMCSASRSPRAWRRICRRSSRPRTSMPHRGSAGSGSARTSTTTRKTSSVSSRCSARSGSERASKVARLRRRLVPGVVFAVLVLDRLGRHLLRRRTVQAGDIDGIKDAAQRLHIALAERLDAAAPAERMAYGTAAEAIIGQRILALQQPECILPGDGFPEPTLGAHRAIAATRTLGWIDLAFKTHGAAMAAASVGVLHRKLIPGLILN